MSCIFGKKIIQPIIKEIIAENKTAEAAMSFTFFMVKLKSGQTRSHNFSIAELIISRLKTTAKQIKITSHSALFNEKKMPAATTNIELAN
jgi:hypothetical protein